MSTPPYRNDKRREHCLDWGLERLAFPATHLLEEAEVPRAWARGLFQEMLQGDPLRLLPYADAVHEDEAVQLLHALLGKTRSPESVHPEEWFLLDELTARMLSEPSKKRRVEKPFGHVQKKRKEREQEEAPPRVDGMVPFWWL